MADYTPIDCARHSEYELAILRAERLRIYWCQLHDQPQVEILKPSDLQTRNHAEYLIAERQNGQRLEIRLDHIRKVEPV